MKEETKYLKNKPICKNFELPVFKSYYSEEHDRWLKNHSPQFCEWENRERIAGYNTLWLVWDNDRESCKVLVSQKRLHKETVIEDSSAKGNFITHGD